MPSKLINIKIMTTKKAIKKVEKKAVDKKEECSKKVMAILEEYGFTLGIVGFCLVPKE